MLPAGKSRWGVDVATQGQPGTSVPPGTPTLGLLWGVCQVPAVSRSQAAVKAEFLQMGEPNASPPAPLHPAACRARAAGQWGDGGQGHLGGCTAGAQIT